MMNINSKMFQKIKDREYRKRFIFGQIKTGIPFQLRALRAARDMTQKRLGDEAKIPQTVISRIENGDGGSLSIKTLLKLADAFDVALVVRFEPIDKLVDWVDNLSPESLAFDTSEKILSDIERKAHELEKAAAAEATPARRLRLADAVTVTGAVQRTLTYDVPQGLPSKTVEQVTAGQSAMTGVGQTTPAKQFKTVAMR